MENQSARTLSKGSEIIMSKPVAHTRSYDTLLNCHEEQCPLVDKKALNDIGRFNPWSEDTHKDSGFYALTVSDQMHVLNSHNDRNRLMKRSYMKKMIKSIEDSGYLISGDPIKFGWDGNLLDGQNRLYACTQNGLDIEAFVVFGIDPDINKRLPFPKTRTVEDILEEENILYEKWETSLLKRIGRLLGYTVDGTTIVGLYNTFAPHIAHTKHWLNKLYALDPKFEKPMYWQDIKTYAVLCDLKNLRETHEVLGAWFNKDSNCNAKLSKDMREMVVMLEADRTHMKAHYKVLKLLCLAHQSVQDGLSLEHGLAQDLEWAKRVIFSMGTVQLPMNNIYWNLIKEEA